MLIESAAPRSTVTTDISSLREDGVEDIFFRYEDTMTHYSVDKMADAAGEDADVELKQNREDISLRLDGETRDDLSERYLEWVPVQTPEPQERLILTHEGVEQKTSEELRRERDELRKQELDMMDFQLAKKRDDLPSLDWWLEPARAETVEQKTSEELRRELDESLKQLAARFEDIAPEEGKPRLFLLETTVPDGTKYTNLLESDLRSYADRGDDWDDLPDTQGEIKLWIPEDLEKAKLWIPEDLGQTKEISISKESLSRSTALHDTQNERRCTMKTEKRTPAGAWPPPCIAGIVVSSGIPAYAARWDIADGDITVRADDAKGTNRVSQGEKENVEDTDTVITGKSKEHTVTIDTSKGNVDVTFDDLKIDVSGKTEGDGSGDGSGHGGQSSRHREGRRRCDHRAGRRQRADERRLSCGS